MLFALSPCRAYLKRAQQRWACATLRLCLSGQERLSLADSCFFQTSQASLQAGACFP